MQLLQRLIKNELNKVNEKYAEVLEEATREGKRQLQRATTILVEELLSSTDAEEEGRGPDRTVDTVTPTLKSVPTAVSIPTDSFEDTVPASFSKSKDTTTKTSPYFNLTFHFTTPTQTTTTLIKKSTGKKTTVTEELSKRIDSTPVPKEKSGGASNIVGGKKSEQPDIAKRRILPVWKL